MYPLAHRCFIIKRLVHNSELGQPDFICIIVLLQFDLALSSADQGAVCRRIILAVHPHSDGPFLIHVPSVQIHVPVAEFQCSAVFPFCPLYLSADRSRVLLSCVHDLSPFAFIHGPYRAHRHYRFFPVILILKESDPLISEPVAVGDHPCLILVPVPVLLRSPSDFCMSHQPRIHHIIHRFIRGYRLPEERRLDPYDLVF